MGLYISQKSLGIKRSNSMHFRLDIHSFKTGMNFNKNFCTKICIFKMWLDVLGWWTLPCTGRISNTVVFYTILTWRWRLASFYPLSWGLYLQYWEMSASQNCQESPHPLQNVSYVVHVTCDITCLQKSHGAFLLARFVLNAESITSYILLRWPCVILIHFWYEERGGGHPRNCSLVHNVKFPHNMISVVSCVPRNAPECTKGLSFF